MADDRLILGKRGNQNRYALRVSPPPPQPAIVLFSKVTLSTLQAASFLIL